MLKNIGHKLYLYRTETEWESQKRVITANNHLQGEDEKRGFLII